MDDRRNAMNFQINSAFWTNDIDDPNEITNYAAYYPEHKKPVQRLEERQGRRALRAELKLDPAKRAAEYREIQQIYVAAAPMLFLYESPFTIATRKNVIGFKQSPLGNDIFDMAYISK